MRCELEDWKGSQVPQNRTALMACKVFAAALPISLKHAQGHANDWGVGVFEKLQSQLAESSFKNLELSLLGVAVQNV